MRALHAHTVRKQQTKRQKQKEPKHKTANTHTQSTRAHKDEEEQKQKIDPTRLHAAAEPYHRYDGNDSTHAGGLGVQISFVWWLAPNFVIIVALTLIFIHANQHCT